MPNTQGTWSTNVLRVSAFFAPGTFGEGDLSLLALFGIEPEQVTSMPAQKSRFEVAPMGLGHLNLQLTLERADLVWSALPSDSDDNPDLGELFESMKLVVTPFARALANTGRQVHRLAIGGVLSYSVADDEEMASKFRELFPRFDLSGEVSDFSLSINRPVMDEVDELPLKLNRICKWSERKGTGIRFEVRPEGIVQQPSAQALAIAMEFDLNTHPGNNLFFTEESIEYVFTLLEKQIPFVTSVPANV